MAQSLFAFLFASSLLHVLAFGGSLFANFFWISDQRAVMIRDAIGKLPPKYRKVIELRHVEERSYEEIAEILKLPIGTVKAHIFRARELLYRQLRGRIRHY